MQGMRARASRVVVTQVVWLGVALSACGSSRDGSSGGGRSGGSANGGTGGGGAGNGGTNSGGTSGGSGLETIDAFCDAYFPALGAYYERCFETGADWTLLLDTVLVCPRMVDAEAAGRLVYTPSNGAACIAALSSDDCAASEDDLSPTSACSAVVGTVAIGGECTSVGLFDINECVGSAYCGGGEAYACTRTCVAFREENESCELTVRCAPDLACRGGVCMLDIEAGVDEPCDGPDAPSCASELYCEGSSSTAAGTCQPARTSGACASSDECAAGYLCNSSGTCTLRKELGESCVEGENECLLFDYCSAGRCTDELATEGAPCLPASGEIVSCAYDYYCDATLGECTRRKALGEDCTSPSECAGPGAHCDVETLTCVPCVPT